MSVSAAWDRVERWLSAHAPDVLPSLQSPATPVSVAELEERLSLKLPPDFVTSVSRHDGQSSEELVSGLFPFSGSLGPEPAWRLLPLSEIERHWTMLKNLVDVGQFDDSRSKPAQGVQAVWWSPRWIPIGDDGGGDHICIDTAPTEGGSIGQIIHFRHDDGARRLLAPSFDALLTTLADNMEAGKYEFNPDDWGLQEIEEC